MDRRPLRNKKSTTRNAKPYDRPNQSILGRVASKFKGIISHWMGTPEDEDEETTNVPEEELDEEDQEELQPTSSRGSKRTRLDIERPAPSILSEGTQTWIHTPTSSIFNPSPRLTSTATQNSILENQDQVIVNGDDHSENSEGSASTSGCSSLVSSHKERSNCLPVTNRRLVQSPFESIRNELSRRDVTSRKEGLSADMSASRMSLWSGGFSPAAKMRRRSPTVAHTNQPGFNVSAFVGSSKSSQQSDRKVASPFYQGKTSFGGASSTRRMPASVAPYQVDRPTRNQIKVRPKESEDSLEGMSSAAKRILMTLEKMSSPVTDAKKIPNTNRSPVDLSLYMMPPRLRSNVVSSPTVTRGPPIANISTISKLTTLKSCMNRFQNSSMESFTSPKVPTSPINTPVRETPQQETTPQPLSPTKGGGGKMRCKLAQKHQPSARIEEFEFTPLPSIPLPISTLPIFKQTNPLASFNPKSSKPTIDTAKSGIEFEFSPPIEVQPALPPILQSNFPSKSDRSSSVEKLPFTFSNPTELELPVSVPGLFTTNLASTKWSCSACWVQNPVNETKCMSCETPRNNSNRLPTTVNSTASSQTASKFNSTKSASTWQCSECWIQNPDAESKCLACDTPKESPATPSVVSRAAAKPSASWSCRECWIQNPADASKCLACDTPKTATSVGLSNNISTTSRITAAKSTSSWACHECWIQNPAHATQCLACEAVRKGESAPTLASSSSGFGESAPKLASSFSSGFGDPAPKSAPASSSGFGENLSKPSSTWKCDSCWVQNPADKAKCLACEAPNPSQAKSSGLKDSESYKFNSPLQNSPISFKFGSFSIPVPTAATTSTSSFGNSSSTGASSFFAAAANLATTTAKSSEEPKSAFSTDTSTPKPVPGFKFGATTVPTIEITKPDIPVVDLSDNDDSSSGLPSNIFGSAIKQTSENSISTAFKVTPVSNASDTGASSFFKPPSSTDKGSEEPKPTLTDLSTPKSVASLFKFGAANKPATEATASNIPVVDLVDNDNKAKLTNMFAAAISKSSSELSASSNIFNITPSIGNTSFSVPASTENKLSPFASAKENSTAMPQPTLNSLPIGSQTGQSKENPSGGFNFKAPTALGSSSPFGGFSMPSSNSDSSKTLLSARLEEKPLLKGLEAGGDKRSDSPFFLGVSSSSNPSPFALTTSNASVFKMGDQVDAAKIQQTSSTNPAIAAPSFSFGVAAATTSSHQFPSKDTKPAVSVVAPFSAAPTTSSFSFGNVAATTTQAGAAPSGGGFSFFAAGTTAATPSLFTFGASTNASQPAKTGGFPAATTTTSAFGASTTTSAFGAATTTSAFGASTPASTSAFVFGAVKAEPVNSTSTFAFGSGTTPSATPSSFSGFQTSQQPAAPAPSVFQFGSQQPANNTSAAPAFGAASTPFAFGAKSEAATSQATGFGVASMQQQPMFGAAAAAKPAGFNFQAAAAPSTPFMFGSMDNKNQQAPNQFSFGTTQEPQQNAAQFQPQPAFNISTPATFNFGAASTQPGPFQFAAASTPEQTAGVRKIRKAVRRVRN